MTKKDRIPDLTFYEWSILRWTTSDTRNELDALGIGIYRELLDRCYAQGSIPKDHSKLATIAKCTEADIEHYWPTLGANFRGMKKRPDRLENPTASVFRSNYFKYCKQQKVNSKKGGLAKASKYKDMSSTRHAQDETRLDETRLDETTAMAGQAGKWPLAAAAVLRQFPATNTEFIGKLVKAASSARTDLSDNELADAIDGARKPDQYSAGLFLTTVPEMLKNRRKAPQPIRRDTPSPVAQYKAELAAELAKQSAKGKL